MDTGTQIGAGVSAEDPPAAKNRKKPKRTAYLMSERPLFLMPKLAVMIGVAEALIVQELHYSIRATNDMFDGYYAVYMKYSDWAHRFPFYSLRWIKGKLFRLQGEGLIGWCSWNDATRGRGHIYYIALDAYLVGHGKRETLPKIFMPGPVIPLFRTLAIAIGLVEALVLQQIHFRCRRGTIEDELHWFGKTFGQWSTDELPCYSPATFKRAIGRLEALDVLAVKRGLCSDVRVKFYRINYPQLAHVLSSSGIRAWPGESGKSEETIKLNIS